MKPKQEEALDYLYNGRDVFAWIFRCTPFRRILQLKMQNGWCMRTTTPAVDTRPSFFAFRPICHASVVANICAKNLGLGMRLLAALLVLTLDTTMYFLQLHVSRQAGRVAINKQQLMLTTMQYYCYVCTFEFKTKSAIHTFQNNTRRPPGLEIFSSEL